MKPVKEKDKSQHKAYRSVPTSVHSFTEKPLCAMPAAPWWKPKKKCLPSVPSHKLWEADLACGILDAYQPWESEIWLPVQVGFSLQAPQTFNLLLSLLLVSSGANGSSQLHTSLMGGSSKTHYWQEPHKGSWLKLNPVLRASQVEGCLENIVEWKSPCTNYCQVSKIAIYFCAWWWEGVIVSLQGGEKEY